MKIAIFSCAGLGDCLNTLILSYNLQLRGNKVVTFHPFMQQMQRWFPTLPISPFPPDYTQFDQFIILYERSSWMQEVIVTCQKQYRKETIILNPIATPNTDYPYWEEGRFDGRIPFADNLVLFCQNILGIPDAKKENGLVLPLGLKPRSCLRQVAIHPTSSRKGKNWPRYKFVKLAAMLRRDGYNPVFVVSPKEREEWPEAPAFQDLDAMLQIVTQSEFMIGNDSGIGHWASLVGVPSLIFFKTERGADFWRPSFFAPHISLVPRGWLPNIKGMRWKDWYWHLGISVQRAAASFHKLCILSNERAHFAGIEEKNIIG